MTNERDKASDNPYESPREAVGSEKRLTVWHWLAFALIAEGTVCWVLVCVELLLVNIGMLNEMEADEGIWIGALAIVLAMVILRYLRWRSRSRQKQRQPSNT